MVAEVCLSPPAHHEKKRGWKSRWEQIEVHYLAQGHFDLLPGDPGIEPQTLRLMDGPLDLLSLWCPGVDVIL